MLVDSHCHVLSSEYDNPDEIIKDSISSGVDKMIINGYDMKSSKEAVELSKRHKDVYVAIGIAPQDVDDYNDNTIDEFQNLIDNNKVVAIGEIGLDYYWTTETKEKQILVFKKMLSLAKKNKLPVIVHSRNAFLDTYNILKEYNVTGIIHCFSGSLQVAKMYSDLDFLLGIGGVVTFKNASKLLNVVKNMDLECFSLETDSPYLSPEPFRGRQNTPKNVMLVAKKIAEIKGLSKEKVIDITGKSVTRKFDL